MRLERTIAMPNEIFLDLKEWLSSGELKSIKHQEFIYAYYWLISYLWRFALYGEQKLSQPDIKKLLKYNPDEKRINYIMKKNGLLDQKGYTSTTTNFPVLWNFKSDNEVKFDMLYDFEEVDRVHMTPNQSVRFFVKSPLKHTGDDENEGIYWHPSNTHIINGEVFAMCMSNLKLGCAGFYLYGIITNMRTSKDAHIISNDALCAASGWSLNKVYEIKSELIAIGLINGILSDGASKGERKIFGFLMEYDVHCIPEYTFDDLLGDGGGKLRFDFAVFDTNKSLRLLIEYDGEHHFQPVDFTGESFEKGEHYLEKTKNRDREKNQYCIDNNIPLLRIPYWEFDNVEKLLLKEMKGLSQSWLYKAR